MKLYSLAGKAIPITVALVVRLDLVKFILQTKLLYPSKGKVAMWDRIFMLSVIVYFVGMLTLLTGEYLIPGWSPVAVPVGGVFAGAGGLGSVVSGIVLILATDFSA